MNARDRVIDYLQSHRVMTVATLGKEGPAAAAVFYVNQGLNFYFLSAAHTDHCRNLLHDPRTAITIHEDYAEWSAIKGVQMHAVGRELQAAELDAVRRLYARKFPQALDPEAASGAIARALLKIRWYELAASHVRFIDNSVRFGHREEWSRAEFAAGGAGPA